MYDRTGYSGGMSQFTQEATTSAHTASGISGLVLDASRMLDTKHRAQISRCQDDLQEDGMQALHASRFICDSRYTMLLISSKLSPHAHSTPGCEQNKYLHVVPCPRNDVSGKQKLGWRRRGSVFEECRTYRRTKSEPNNETHPAI